MAPAFFRPTNPHVLRPITGGWNYFKKRVLLRGSGKPRPLGYLPLLDKLWVGLVVHGDQLLGNHGVDVIVASAKFNQELVGSHSRTDITTPVLERGGVVKRGVAERGGGP